MKIKDELTGKLDAVDAATEDLRQTVEEMDVIDASNKTAALAQLAARWQKDDPPEEPGDPGDPPPVVDGEYGCNITQVPASMQWGGGVVPPGEKWLRTVDVDGAGFTYDRFAGMVRDADPWTVFRLSGEFKGAYGIHLTEIDKEIMILSHPDNPARFNVEKYALGLWGCKHITVKGLSATSVDRGMDFASCEDVLIRDCSFRNCRIGIQGGRGSKNVNLYWCDVIGGDRSGSHAMYLVSTLASGTNDRLDVVGCLLRGHGRTGLQHNGPSEGLLVRGNIIADNLMTGVSFESGVCRSLVRNNLVVGNGRGTLTFYDYNDGADSGIVPLPQEGNRIEHNTLVVPSVRVDGSRMDPYAAIRAGVATEALVGLTRGNVATKNLICSSAGPWEAVAPQRDDACEITDNRIVQRSAFVDPDIGNYALKN